MSSVSLWVYDGVRNLVGNVPAIAIILVAIVVVINVVVWDFVLVDPDVVDQIRVIKLNASINHRNDNIGAGRPPFPGLRCHDVFIIEASRLAGVQ